MKILIACERSGIVREAFRKRGHEVVSCDIEPSLDDSPYHVTGDVRPLLKETWDLVIGFPPCTYLSFITRYNNPKYISLDRLKKQRDSIKFVLEIWSAAECVCIENPLGWLGTYWRKPSQTFQPYEFGDDVQKRTCFWLKNLPAIFPFFRFPGKKIRKVIADRKDFLEARGEYIFHPGARNTGSFERSLFHEGTAARMAELWG